MSSTGQSQYGCQDSTIADTREDIHYGLLDSMMAATNEEINFSNLPKFPKVPSTIRQIKQNEECYDPSLVSIGPYHHGKDELKAMEKLKVTFARQFVKDCVNDFNQERYKEKYQEMYRRVEQVASRVRKYYIEDESSQLKNKEFAQMMFFDGCFILQFLFCLLKQPEKLKMSSHDVVLVARDLFLLENQLPYEVLDELTRLGFGGEKIELFEAFFKHIRSKPTQRESCREKTKKNLLTISQKFCRILSSTNPKGQESEMTPRKPAHLLELFHFKFVGSKEVPDASTRKSWYRDDSRKTWSGRYFPAKELRNVGIHFKPSKTSFFTDVEFRRTVLAGRLYIPPLSIDDSTKPLLLNLVAYEACLGDIDKLWVTSYICFMDSLIDNPEDVNELRTKGVLFSTLGNDKQVAELFNQISDYLVPNPYAYVQVKSAIESHYRNGFKRWILHYKGPIYSSVLKYSFIYGLIVSAIKAYVVIVPTNPDLGICKMPATNAALNP
ncbi:PREDICTED: UPF0481 protein At3g47200-like [Populus euphratica]|uniref:UPF0481 protein At3g47200-like n=1 Tax=Populus euphratica TaxID=75702 RepID=A0AAJ6X041_POPEU|nr:PREDICTED: UPF0481 protein At3g47200-like [Populus euphratica]